MIFALVASLLAAVLVLLGSSGSGRQVGNAIFPVLTTLAFVYCLLAGARRAADSISEEKREGTLGLLFLTDLRGYDIVLGKLVAVSTRTIQGLLAFFPVLALGLVLGGVTGGEVARATGLLINALFFSLCVSLWISSLSRTSYAALGLSLGLLALLTLGPIGADWLTGLIWPGHLSWLRFVSPASAADFADDVTYRLGPGRFWSGLALNHLLGWFFLIAASLTVPRTWQDRPSQSRTSSLSKGRGETTPARDASRRKALRERLLKINPVLWLAARNEEQRALLWSFVAAMAILGGLILCLTYAKTTGSLGMTSVVTLVLRLVLRLWVVWRACAILAEAQRTGAIELLLATPLRVDDIIRGHWQALQRFFLWPVVGALGVSLFPAVEMMLQNPTPSFGLMLFPIPATMLFGMITFVVDLIALAWVGMWMGLTKANPVQAFATTVFVALVVPAVLFCIPNILFDLFWISWARRNLQNGFRQAATERYSPSARLPAGPSTPPPMVGV